MVYMNTVVRKINLNSLSCEHLTGVGKRIAERLQRLGIHQIQDILFHLPMRYQDRTRIHAIRDLVPGDYAVIQGDIVQVALPKGGRTKLLLHFADASGRLQLRFFHAHITQLHSLQKGTKLRCFGEVRLGASGLEMIHPEYQVMLPGMILPVEEKLTPIYPTTEGVSQALLRKLTAQALELLANGGILQDVIPIEILQKHSFPTLEQALKFVHRPPVEAARDALLAGQHVTQKRLVFEELLAHRLSLLQIKKSFQLQKAISFCDSDKLKNDFLSLLPFQLTKAQQRVAIEIAEDLQKPFPMLRLLQGDVGSGKTVVAALAIVQAVESGFQSVVLAPTELLAEQHFEVFRKWFTAHKIETVFLSGQMKKSERRVTLEKIANHQAHLIVGTHAVFQKEVEFAKLALIVIDEQHRFGVQQRAALREKGMNQDYFPHQLIMTATPIPRTLAMSVYADLDYSIIDELPPGRTPVKTSAVENNRRNDVFQRIREACLNGRQAYWVCTLIEESETLQCKAAENVAHELSSALPELKIGLLHGRMKSAEKESIMQLFKNKKIHLLVATTVIEVGVDVPNASLMVVENAERLGLAQLHQLRGRVGRGSIESYCLLLYQSPLSQLARERLLVMRETNDGFRIAQRDLELRGPGEVLGTRQTGEISLRIANLSRDSELLPAVQEAGDFLQKKYPEKVSMLIQRWIGHRHKYSQV